jgi:lysophospholipase L1-like esterase
MRQTIFSLLLPCALLAVGKLVATEPSAPAKPTPQATPYQPKDTRRHDEFVNIARAGGVDVVFFGDSITDYWRRPANKVLWDIYFAPLKAANFGIAGEGTRELLWRIQNGELEGIHPRLVVVLIGTNNIGEKPEKITAGIKEILDEIQRRSPGTRILLHGIFPRGPYPAGSGPRIVQVNQTLATFAQPNDPKRVIFLDIGDRFLNPDRTVNKELMPDTLHLSAKGYEVWAGAIIDTVTRELQ